MKRIVVAGAQVPFAFGGAELLNHGLIGAIKEHFESVEVDLIQLPYSWYPEQRIVDNIFSWRMLDLSSANGKKIDLVIATKFPSYAVQHENKVLWLVHQYRQMYDLKGTIYDPMTHAKAGEAVREKLYQLDQMILRECRALTAISSNVATRLKKFNGLESAVVMPPPKLREKIVAGTYGEYILCIGRIDRLKRPQLALEALAHCPEARLKFIGGGDELLLGELHRLVDSLALGDRVQFLGFVSEGRLLDELAHCRAVVYLPQDEDFGFAAIEALLAQKPVITCQDSGEVAAIVQQTGGGIVADAHPMAIGKAIELIYQKDKVELESMSLAGLQFAKGITWENVMSHLVRPYL